MGSAQSIFRAIGSVISCQRWHIYPWAGQLPNVDIRKPTAGAQPFLPVSMIARSAGFVFDQLRRHHFLQAAAPPGLRRHR